MSGARFILEIYANMSAGLWTVSGAGSFFHRIPGIRTSGMVRQIARRHGKRIILVKGLNWAVGLLAYAPGKIGRMVNKAFGSLVYEKGIDVSFSGVDDRPV